MMNCPTLELALALWVDSEREWRSASELTWFFSSRCDLVMRVCPADAMHMCMAYLRQMLCVSSRSVWRCWKASLEREENKEKKFLNIDVAKA